MSHPGDLKKCRVLIKSAVNGQLLADTQITDYDLQKNILKIRPSSLTVSAAKIKDGPITAMVFGQNGLYEYNGRIRVVTIANEVEIQLFSGKTKESRKNTRYEVQLQGKAEAIIWDKQRVFLREPIEVMTKNVSGNGVLIQAMTGSFEKGDCLQLVLQLNGTEIRGDYRVVRKQNSNLWTEEYGCRKIAHEKKGW